MELVFFSIFSSLAIVSAMLVIIKKNVIHSALFLILSFCSVASLYVLLDAELLAAVQILVYAGAIMVLYIFAILLINIERERIIAHVHSQSKLALGVGVLLLIEIVFIISNAVYSKPLGTNATIVQEGAKMGNTELIASVLYTKFLLPFEVVAVLLLAAMIGTIFLAKKDIK